MMPLSEMVTRIPVASNPYVLNRGRSDLCRLFADRGFRSGAEIGVWTGKFSKAICEAVPGVHLLCVDPWSYRADYHEKKNDVMRLGSAYAEARERLRSFNCELMRMTSLEAVVRVPDRSLDFVYIDANHAREHVLADLSAWSHKVRRGGVVSGHDFHTSPTRPWIEVEAAVRDFATSNLIGQWFVLAGDKSPSFFWVVS